MTTREIIAEQIIHLVKNHRISEQIDLQELLKVQGYDIPQATLSRRLKSLNIVKVAGFYQMIQANMAVVPIVLSLKISEFGMIILHTHPGQANSLAYFIDQKYVAYHPEETKQQQGIMGTIAGDDTVLLILKNQQSVEETLTLLKTDFPYLRT